MCAQEDKALYGRHYPGLDLVRVTAIAMVMLTHLSSRAFNLPGGPAQTFITWGWHGVDLFFALSGFLIGGQIMEQSMTGRFSFRTFYIKRVWRIFPPYYFSLLVMLTIYAMGAKGYFRLAIHPLATFNDIVRSMAVHIFYLVDYLGSIYDFQQGIYWSLAVEEQFYILAPLLLYLLVRYGRRLTPWGLGTLILCGIALRFALFSLPAGPGFDWEAAVQRPFHTRFDTLLFGVLAAYLFIKHRDRLATGRATRAAVLALSLASVGASLVFGGFGPGYFNTCWQFTLTGFGFSGLVLWLAVTPLAGRIRPRRAFNYVARISYPMYLYHLILIRPAYDISTRLFGFNRTSTTQFFLFFAVYSLVVVFVSGVLYRLVDVPFMNYRKRFV
ncbi:MAG: acyltransferase family protein [Thermodesulfobacteriota bacterium]